MIALWCRGLQLVLDGQPLAPADQGVAADRHDDERLLRLGLRRYYITMKLQLIRRSTKY